MNKLFLISAALLIVVFLMNRGCEKTEHFSQKKNVDCDVSSWSEWSECSGPCKDIKQNRSRTVIRDKSGNGKPCPQLIENRDCTRNLKCRLGNTEQAPPPEIQAPPRHPPHWMGWKHMVDAGNAELIPIKNQINDAKSSCKNNSKGQTCTQLKNRAKAIIHSNNEYKGYLCAEGMKNNPEELRRYCVGGSEGPERFLL
jgi:hypothetical protein